ncbi:MAG TPA: hypothetical protein VFV47_08615 [Hyphomicrobiaceae bacterium]|nr:hypothetical protein [Hyphomicrobiaceae bacterium]
MRPAFLRYLAWSAPLHLLWEALQLPLYTLWTTAGAGTQTYAVLHCTVGDIMIAAATLAAAMIALRASAWPRSATRSVWLTSLALGVGYTVVSEWINVEIRGSWAYSEYMPILPFLGTGLSPLLQWLVVPTAAQWIALGHRPWRA